MSKNWFIYPDAIQVVGHMCDVIGVHENDGDQIAEC